MTRQDPPGVTYQGGDGIYHIHLHGRRIGIAVSNHSFSGREAWSVTAQKDDRWVFTAPTRHQAATGLVTWLQGQK